MDTSQMIVTFLVNAMWQIPVIAVITSICSKTMRRTPSAYRHMLWVVALGASLGLPLLSTANSGENPDTSKTGVLQASTAQTTPPGRQSPVRRSGFSFGMHRHTRFVPVAPLLKWTLIGCYGGLILYRAVKMGWAVRSTLRFGSDSYSRPLPRHLADIARLCMDKFSLPAVEIRSSAAAVSPATITFRQSLLTMPDQFFTEVSESDFSYALCHELAHIRRRDFLLNFVYELLYIPVWFHPVASLIKARIDVTRESACDEAAVDILDTNTRNSCARSLLNIAQTLGTDSPAANPTYALGLFDTNSLEERIMNLIGKTTRIGRTRAIVLAGTLLSLLTLSCLGLSGFSLQAAQVTSIPTDASQYVGTWTAKHDGTPFIILDVRREKGKLVGGMRMANNFHMDNEGSDVKIEIYNDALLESLPVRNFQNSDKSLTFDFKDPDGDETHWKLEVTGVNVGRLSWVGLPDGIKDVPVPVTKG